ncbi:hypothetical protein [Enteractinococcus helveticum]|uniref:Uncharacterized protein n=1 Tax=Enteractinococcus helveticum TaxID=1837282 RepID=A0A1B7M0D8_9MICC|nr:hypothetical protein [Enteractinococcus helveticum]OAV61505.1 hypothetical protein A6F49_08650 [Enteractinococcus helveticum]
MSRLILTRLAWVAVGLVAIVTAAFAIQPIMSGPEDLDLGPVVFNTHEPVPTESETPELEPSETSAEPTETSAPESQPVVPAPPVIVEDYDDDWDDDDWDDDDDDWDDDWDDDDDDDDWDDDDD